MKEYHIINPAAGHGTAEAMAQARAASDAVLYNTTGVGDARRYLAQTLRGLAEDVRVFVYGGDGTIGEAVNGIMDAQAADHAILTAVPCGTGNDFVRMFADAAPDTEYRLDLLSCGDGYVLNMINIGFDCAVVDRTAVWKKKPFVRGGFAYICGILDVLFRPMGTPLRISYTDENGETHTEEGSFLLCAAANAQYCGGGFRGAPTASLTDGVAELLIVDLITRRRFFGLVGMYHDGTHIGADGLPVKKIADVLRYVRCKKAAISGMTQVCRDGEVAAAESLSFEVVPGVLRYRT
ncbi:MAG: hypothetical protein IJ302_09250 [Clostridia bacterium]|nr:hypothetical protein [Clostridia bacterium]